MDIVSCLGVGLGKTLQAIGVMAYYREHWPALIIVPSSIRLQVNAPTSVWDWKTYDWVAHACVPMLLQRPTTTAFYHCGPRLLSCMVAWWGSGVISWWSGWGRTAWPRLRSAWSTREATRYEVSKHKEKYLSS